jgi:cell division protein FtsB
MVSKDVRVKSNWGFGKLFTALVVLVVLLSITRVVLANLLAVSGEQIAAANQKAGVLEEEDQKLENEISKVGSLALIEEKAKDAGFVKADNVEILPENKPIASR